ncbi:hypothetical protein BDQ12DRAFT_684331, partial [Crucibulum laeve]
MAPAITFSIPPRDHPDFWPIAYLAIFCAVLSMIIFVLIRFSSRGSDSESELESTFQFPQTPASSAGLLRTSNSMVWNGAGYTVAVSPNGGIHISSDSPYDNPYNAAMLHPNSSPSQVTSTSATAFTDSDPWEIRDRIQEVQYIAAQLRRALRTARSRQDGDINRGHIQTLRQRIIDLMEIEGLGSHRAENAPP